ncbi:methanogenesis marker 6 protein [Methanofollis fontis]|uniref:Methanogenesis marker 6 protein n=1 Tax=Methanofollis fontis TaxID=2052832 RepID=A0A483CZV6_9EURY|nr:methanogenesis marker 6 protein [Methanofollis fontis]TAJ45739.1 methanogenesis marker 6 protein [Methanofollis fontis]
MAEYEPQYVGTVTKYVFIDSPLMTPKDLAIHAYEVSEGVMIKETCFGLQVTGTPDEVERLIAEVRALDPTHIFVKDRGFPPGDERRCRANLGGARPGYLGHEFEMRRVRYITKGLEAAAGGAVVPAGTAKRTPLDARKLKEMMEAEEP